MKKEIALTIYQEEGNFIFAHYGAWATGIYENELTCVFASQVEEEKLQALWKEVLTREKEERVITLIDIDRIAPELRIGSLFG